MFYYLEIVKNLYHKITNETVKIFGKQLKKVINEFFESLIVNNVKVIVGHNVEEDIRIIKNAIYDLSQKFKSCHFERLYSIIENIYYITNSECSLNEKSHVNTLPIHISNKCIFAVCTSKLTKNYTKLKFNSSSNRFKQPKLIELYEKCKNKKSNGNHCSMNDAFMTAECFYAMIEDPDCPKEFLIVMNKLIDGNINDLLQKKQSNYEKKVQHLKVISFQFYTNTILLNNKY